MAAEQSTPIASVGIQRGSGWVITLGILQIIVGILAIILPFILGVVFVYVIGAALIIGGILQIIYAFQGASMGSGLLSVVVGCLSIIVGIIVMLHPVLGLDILTILLIVYFAVDGFARIILAFEQRVGQGQGWSLFMGVISLLLALLLFWDWPWSGQWAIGIFVGVQLLFIGWMHVVMGMAGRAGSAAALDG